MPKYAIVEDACRYCWNKNFMDAFKDFHDQYAPVFRDAPINPTDGEQDLEFYELFQKYMKIYENTLSDYIESLDCTIDEFYHEVAAIKDDPQIKDKKLLHFVNYLIGCTDYPSFYKVMVRAAKKLNQAESKAESKSSGDDKISASTTSDSKQTRDSKDHK